MAGLRGELPSEGEPWCLCLGDSLGRKCRVGPVRAKEDTATWRLGVRVQGLRVNCGVGGSRAVPVGSRAWGVRTPLA